MRLLNSEWNEQRFNGIALHYTEKASTSRASTFGVVKMSAIDGTFA